MERHDRQGTNQTECGRLVCQLGGFRWLLSPKTIEGTCGTGSYSRRMDREPTVLIREICQACDGAGKQRIEAGAGHVSWTKTADCAACDGNGYVSRWARLSEFRDLLDLPASSEPQAPLDG